MSLSVSRKSLAAALVAICAGTMILAPVGSAALVAPKPIAGSQCNLQGTPQDVDRLGVFAWNPVAGADHYEFYVSADPQFSSDLFSDTSIGHFTTRNTRATVTRTLPNAQYYWKVRAVSATNAGGAWSGTCTFNMHWTDQSAPQSPADGGTLKYPHPLLLDWTAANGAKQYRLSVSNAPDLSSPVVQVTTTATQFSPGSRLPSGNYFWGVTPIDAEGHDGTPSAVFNFTWDWPATDTTLSVADLDPSAEVFDPQFSWTAIPGAASYELEINSDINFATGSKICCDNTSIVATSFSPTMLLPADTYYWRVRAKDPSGNFGPWVVAPDNDSPPATFTINYDTGGISNLTMDDPTGNDVWTPGFSTDTPIVSWNPTPGAASYEVDVVPFTSSVCQYGAGAPAAWHVETAATAWTPLGAGFNVQNPFPNTGHPGVAGDSSALQPGTQYCVRVRARRNVDSKNHIVYGAYKQLGSPGNPAFTFTGYPTGNPCTAPCNANVNIGAGDYLQPLATGNTRLPVFTWNPISGVQSYVVIVATDNTFQDVIDEAFTQIPAYAPRGTIPVTNYPDTSTNYAWAVLPAQGFDGSGGASDPTTASSYPQTFDLHSVAPTPIEPLAGAVETTQPTFEWSPVVGAYQYKLYVTNNGVPVAGSPFITSGTSFTASNFPASNQLSWKVQALDRSGNGLTFSAAQQFSYSLAAPTFTVTNPTSGDGIPVWQWDPMPGAIAYDVHVQLPSNGQGQTDFSGIDSTAFTPTTMTGTGVFTWSVRAEYPTAGSNATSAYSAPQTFARTIQAPQHPTTAVAGAKQVSVTWDPKNTAKSYTVQFATDSGFGSSVFDQISDTENTAFAPVLTASQYIEGGPIYWRVAAKDADGNQGAWTTPQLLTMPSLIHLAVTGSVSKGMTTTLKVTAKTGAGKAIAGVSIKDGGCGLKAKTLKTGAGGAVSFKVKPTKSGMITFTATKTGAVGSKVQVAVY